MKSFLIFTLLTALNLFSQKTTTKKENIWIILGTTDPFIAEYIFADNTNSKFLLKTYKYEYKFGEYIKKNEPSSYITINYNSEGILEYDYFSSPYIQNQNGKYERDFLNHPIKLGLKGEQSNKPYLRYEYNTANELIELKQYTPEGKLENRFVFEYNAKKQISKVLEYKGESTIIANIKEYTYNLNGSRLSVVSYEPTKNKNFPKFESYKAYWTYDKTNRMITYTAFKTRYGYYGSFSDDLNINSNGKLRPKTLAENLKSQKESWKELQLFEYNYIGNDNCWNTRKEFTHKYKSIVEKEYSEIVEKTLLNQ